MPGPLPIAELSAAIRNDSSLSLLRKAVMLELLICHQQEYDNEGAWKVVVRRSGQPDQEYFKALRFIEADTSLSAHLTRALLYHRIGQQVNALQDVETALESHGRSLLHAKFGAPRNDLDVEVPLVQAIVYFGNGKIDEALALMDLMKAIFGEKQILKVLDKDGRLLWNEAQELVAKHRPDSTESSATTDPASATGNPGTATEIPNSAAVNPDAQPQSGPQVDPSDQ